MATNSTFRILDSVEIAMRDGSNLRANVWLPDETGQWPVLLQRTPYRKDDAVSTLDFLAALPAAVPRTGPSPRLPTRQKTAPILSLGCASRAFAMAK